MKNGLSSSSLNPANIYLFKIINRNTGKRCVLCSKLTIKTCSKLTIKTPNSFF